MLKYCKNCDKEIDFPASEVTAAKPLICPECGQEIPKYSRSPRHDSSASNNDEAIGNAFAVIMHIAYIFYIVLAVIGAIGFFTGAYGLLYVTAGISVGVFILQAITQTTTFPLGMILVPLGAVLGYFLLKGIPGACLGIHIVFAARHLVRDVLYRLVFWFIEKISK